MLYFCFNSNKLFTIIEAKIKHPPQIIVKKQPSLEWLKFEVQQSCRIPLWINRSFTISVTPVAWIIPVPSSRSRSFPFAERSTTVPCTQTWLIGSLLYSSWWMIPLPCRTEQLSNWLAKNFLAAVSSTRGFFCDIRSYCNRIIHKHRVNIIVMLKIIKITKVIYHHNILIEYSNRL